MASNMLYCCILLGTLPPQLQADIYDVFIEGVFGCNDVIISVIEVVMPSTANDELIHNPVARIAIIESNLMANVCMLLCVNMWLCSFQGGCSLYLGRTVRYAGFLVIFTPSANGFLIPISII